jgi:hypothetical protein
MHAAGLRVLLGTLTPFNGRADLEAQRAAVNQWIRTSHAADGVIDFDAAVRDPSAPSRLQPGYDGGDGGHLDLAGYKALGDAVPLEQLLDPTCVRSLSLRITPRHLTAGRRRTIKVVVRADGVLLPGALVRFGSTRATTGADGVARLRVRPRSVGRRTLVITADGAASRRVAIRVRRR